jgi:hypothetical protein
MADKSRLEERDKGIRERRKARMEADFDSGTTPEHPSTPEMRLAVAAEYAAFQLGQMNRKLDVLIELSRSGAAKK